MTYFLNTYNYFYNKTIQKSESFFLASIKKCYKNEFDYNYFENNASNRIKNYKNYILKNIKTNYPYSFDIFNNRASYFTKNIITNIFEGIVKSEFEKENKLSHLKSYTYLHFIADLAIYESLRTISSVIEINSNLYKKMFKLNKFESFKLTNPKNDSEILILDKQLREELYGKDESVDKIENPIIQVKSKMKSTNSESTKIQELDSDLAFFNDEDKTFLLHICFNHMEAIPLTEFAKINYITSGLFNEDFLLNKNTANSTFYRRLNTGFNYFSNKKTAREKLKSLIYKVEGLNTLNLTSLLNVLRNELSRT